MNVNLGQALGAYVNAAKQPVAGMEARDSGSTQGFASLVGDALKSAADVGYSAETQSIKAVAGEADLTEVVTAVANAEVALNTVVAVRDRVIQAYQDVLRMPI